MYEYVNNISLFDLFKSLGSQFFITLGCGPQLKIISIDFN